MASSFEFSLIESDCSHRPHYFAAYRHDSNHIPAWNETVEMCLQAWMANADAYRVDRTGFASDGIVRTLNKRGRLRLPATPPEDNNITRDSCVTDVTEILALRLLNYTMPRAVFPCPHVLHKERTRAQHRGIDILGFEETDDGTTLLIVEVMASIEGEHPSTVGQHVAQLLDGTLNEELPERLLDELGYVLAGTTDDKCKTILNGFIAAVCDGTLSDPLGQRAVAILVRPLGLWFVSDWEPFLRKTDRFEGARIPATVWFGTVACDSSFSVLIDKIKDTAVN